MHTIKQILEQVDRVKPNAFSPETKLVWIAELDGKIALNVMLMDKAELDAFHYQYPDSLDKEPLVPFPHNVLYEKWLIAQIDAANEEWNRYANDIEIYNSYYKDFVRWFASTYQPAQGGMERCGTYPRYFLTAYGLAVQQGFPGSLQEWLLSLRGDPGATPQKGVDYYTEEELEEMLGRFSDRVPKDWFASGKEIPEEADLDGYREPGKFYAANTAVASTLKNCPTDADFTLWVFDRVSDNRKNHMLIDGENRLFFRGENAGGWKEWVAWAALDETLEKRGFAADALAVKQALEKLSAADVGALSIDGGTMKGDFNMGGHVIWGLSDPTGYDQPVPYRMFLEELAKKAPDGYGLGTSGEVKNVTSLDELKSLNKNGWYFIRFPGQFHIDGQYAQFMVCEVAAETNEHVHQTLHLVGTNYKLHCNCDLGDWREWEWENPPMALGWEYRTTERFFDKPVYAQAINIEALPNGTTESFPLGCTVDKVVAIFGTSTHTNGARISLPYFDTTSNFVQFWVNTDRLFVSTAGAFDGFSGCVYVKYTKA